MPTSPYLPGAMTRLPSPYQIWPSVLMMSTFSLLVGYAASGRYLAAVGALPDGPRCREDLLSFTAWAAGAGRAGLPALIRATCLASSAGLSAGGVEPGGSWEGKTRPAPQAPLPAHSYNSPCTTSASRSRR